MTDFDVRWEFDVLVGEPVDGITSTWLPANWCNQPVMQIKDDHADGRYCAMCNDRTGAAPVVMGSVDAWTSLASRPPIPDEVLDQWVRVGPSSAFVEWRHSDDALKYVRVKYMGLTADGEVA